MFGFCFLKHFYFCGTIVTLMRLFLSWQVSQDFMVPQSYKRELVIMDVLWIPISSKRMHSGGQEDWVWSQKILFCGLKGYGLPAPWGFIVLFLKNSMEVREGIDVLQLARSVGTLRTPEMVVAVGQGQSLKMYIPSVIECSCSKILITSKRMW